jgi:sugar/nucleoside kinase (ribokinase family)
MIAIKQVCSENNIKKFVWGKTIWRNLQVQYVRGGVARNVAESMAQLGTCPLLISVVGEDFAGWLFRFQLLSFFVVVARILLICCLN